MSRWLPSIFIGSRKDPRANHDFSEEDREKSAVVRLEKAVRRKRLEIQKARLERLHEQLEEQQMEEQIADLEDQLDGDDNQDPGADALSPDALFMGLLAKIANGKQPANVSSSASVPVEQTRKRLTDDQLKTMRARIPAPVLKKLARMDPEEIVEQISMYDPDFLNTYDDDTVKRAVAVLRG